MKELTRIEPEPEVNEEISIENLKWLSERITHGLCEGGVNHIVRLLVHKVNELTDEVNGIKRW